jgi:hypothetical protein
VGYFLLAADVASDSSRRSIGALSSFEKTQETIMDQVKKPDASEGVSANDSAGDRAQRDALKQSEKAAAEQQPGSFKEDETESKKVEIGPDMTDQPIKGIDPESDRGSRK